MRVQSEGERRLWTAAMVLVGAIYVSAYFAQFALDFLRERNLLRLTIGAAFALVAGVVIATLVRAGARWRAWSTLALVGVAYTGAALGLSVVQERIHLLESGALALLLRAALSARAAADPDFGLRGKVAASCGAFALTFLAGVGDEALQGIVPNRHADLRDLGLNAGAAAMALVVTGSLELALAGDRRATETAR